MYILHIYTSLSFLFLSSLCLLSKKLITWQVLLLCHVQQSLHCTSQTTLYKQTTNVSSIKEIQEEEDQMGPSLLVQSQTKSRVVHIAWFVTCFLAVKVSILLLKLLIVTNSFN